MPHWNNQPWQRNSSKIASGKPGAVQPSEASASVTVSMQKPVSRVIESFQAKTFRLNQSMTAARWTKPRAMGM